MLQVITA